MDLVPPFTPDGLNRISTTSRLSELFLGEEDNVCSGVSGEGSQNASSERTGITREPRIHTETVVCAGLKVFQTKLLRQDIGFIKQTSKDLCLCPVAALWPQVLLMYLDSPIFLRQCWLLNHLFAVSLTWGG